MKVGELIDKYVEIRTSMADLEHLKRGKDKYWVERLEKAIRLLDAYTEMIRELNANNKMASEAVGPVKLEMIDVAGIVEFLERRIQFLEYELRLDCLDQNQINATKTQIAEATHILNTVKTMRKESEKVEE